MTKNIMFFNVLSMLLMFSTSAFSTEIYPSGPSSVQLSQKEQPSISQTDNAGATASTNTPASFKKDLEPQRSGCCSHHDGVCGCKDDRAVCCDGTLSPSCGCN